MIRAVLLDMDGTVLDTERINKICWQKAMAETGYHFEEKVYFDLIGLNDKSMCQYFADNFGFTREQFDQMKLAGYSYSRAYKAEHGVPIKQGFLELSDYLRQQNIKTAAVTSSTCLEAQHNFRSAGIEYRFDLIIGGDSVTTGKPSPEPYLKAAEGLGLQPSECLAAEDSANGIRSAHAAGIKCVYIKDIADIAKEAKALAAYKASTLDELIQIIGNINR